jgi:hypothetical protein
MRTIDNVLKLDLADSSSSQEQVFVLQDFPLRSHFQSLDRATQPSTASEIHGIASLKQNSPQTTFTNLKTARMQAKVEKQQLSGTKEISIERLSNKSP